MHPAKHPTATGASLVAALAVACGSSNPSYGGDGGTPGCTASTAIATTQVAIAGMAFSPACVKVTAPATVTFTNGDAVAHTVTADDGAYDSGTLAPSQAFQHAYVAAGRSDYHCAIHPGMKGTVIAE